MSLIKASSDHLVLSSDGSTKEVQFQIDGVEKASISSAGAFTSTTIDATALTGALPAIDGSSLTGVSGGKVLQVVQYTNSSAYSTTSTSYQQAHQTGTFTLTNSSNKVLVMANFQTYAVGSSAGAGGYVALYRGSVASGTRLTTGIEPMNYHNNAVNGHYNISMMQYLDTPTGNTTYSIGHRRHNNSTSHNIAGDNFQTVITMMEIEV